MSFFFGAGDEARTRYLHLAKVALYQMSYTCSDKWYYSQICRRCQGVNSEFLLPFGLIQDINNHLLSK